MEFSLGILISAHGYFGSINNRGFVPKSLSLFNASTTPPPKGSGTHR